MVTAHELGLADQLTLRRTVVRMSDPNLELLPDNPISKIPTLVLGDGTIICESIVICERSSTGHSSRQGRRVG